MKYLTRYLSLLLCFALLFIVFSVSVSAEEMTVKPYNVYVQSNGLFSGDFTKTITTFNEVYNYETNGYVISLPYTYYINFYFGYNDNSNMVKKGETVKISVEDLYVQGSAHYNNTPFFVSQPTKISGYVMYNDNTTDYVEIDRTTDNYYGNDISFQIKASKDIRKFCITTEFTIPYTSYSPIGIHNSIGNNTGNDNFILRIDKVDEKVGLLQTVIQWLSSLKDGITNVFNSIVELPSKIWELISNGLKSLFVPADDFIINFKDDLDSMLEEKLGAVYQVVNILLESWDRITANDQTNVITIPQTTIDLPQNNKFSFGGIDVQIVPNGFEWLVDIIKTLVGIVCTVLFVNGLRKKYDEVMGVEQ